MFKTADRDLQTVDAVSFVRPLRGGSQSALIRASDGLLYKAKFFNNPQGPNLLANEWIGTALAASSGLPVAPSTMIRVSDRFLDQYPEMTFQYADRSQRLDAGIHFGSLYMGQDNRSQRIFEYLPRSQRRHLFKPKHSVGIALFDILTVHADSRQAVFTKHPSKPKIVSTYVDFGHLFGGPHWGSVSQKWPAYHYTSSSCPELWTDKEVFSWISKFQTRIPQAFALAKTQVPRCWHEGDLDTLEKSLVASLESFPASIASFLFHQGSKLSAYDCGASLPTCVAL